MVNIGDRCQFKFKEKRVKSVIGQVIGFIYLNKKTKKESRYDSNSAVVCDESVGVLGNWFVKNRNSLKFFNIDTYIPIKDYMNHTEKPDINSLTYI